MGISQQLGDPDDPDIASGYKEPDDRQTRKLDRGHLTGPRDCYFEFDLEKGRASEPPTEGGARNAVRYFRVVGLPYVEIGELDKSPFICFASYWNKLIETIKDAKLDKDQRGIEFITNIVLGAYLPSEIHRKNFIEGIRSGGMPKIEI